MGIDAMEDVELLVGIFYEYNEKFKEEQKADDGEGSVAEEAKKAER